MKKTKHKAFSESEKKRILKSIGQGVTEMKMYLAGKIKLKEATDLLKEL